ncbi:NAD-dependent epimerase/dehydratase family protein [Caballeronia sp. SL2Y3]|uniref:NAD-dependent epimerase/dehydratase family protein n=1 Tax=Caballeronia sp. SL2Y3 TaxID=2878151 RepID=UPI001FD0FB41|nr:NAD-dependent epimerase/dehydratase family protein [Caballeronia sp. SL2Y3]
MTRETALVLGATGGIGGEVARQLRDAGWHVRGLRRSVAASEQTDGIEWIHGDAMNRADVTRAAKGATVIVHAVNPPGYKRWADFVLPMLDNTIAAAKTERATIVLPGTVYNFGPDAFPAIAEDAPQNPVTKKGAIRVEMEARLERASREGVQTLIVRAGDFFGPKGGNNWFSQGLVKPGKPVQRIVYPGTAGVGHAWSYLPDVARTMVELLARRDTLDRFARFHMRGHWDEDGTQFAAAIQRVVARQTGRAPSIGAFPWWLLTLASPFNATFREMREMGYLWRTPVRMINTRLVEVLGHEPHTPLDDAIEATLVGLRCVES